MLHFLKRRWFVLSILLLIPLGIWLGFRAEPSTVSGFPKGAVQILSGVMTALILFLMASTLQSHRLIESLKSPGPVLWGSVVNFVLIPAMTLVLLPLQQLTDFKMGLMVAASVPCTLAASSVWTRKAGGNDAISLLITVLTNGCCFLLTPFWLQIGLGKLVGIDTRDLIVQLFVTALLPILAGQGLRMWTWFREFADRGQTGFNTLAQICILAIVFWAAVQSGVKFNAGVQSDQQTIRLGPALIVWGSCVFLHLTAFQIALFGGVLLRFRRKDAVGSAFAASQKTLPIGLFVAAGLVSTAPFVVIPVLMYHASQLLLDSVLLDRLNRWVQASPVANSPRN